MIQEFDVDVYRQHMKELLMLKQTDIVELYKQKFLQIVYSVRLYEPTISDTFLVTRFVMGLKEELRAGLEVQIRQTVQMAAFYASVQEGLLAPQKSNKFQYPKQAYAKSDIRQGLALGELWKAKQLKEYRRANGLCFKCEEKFIPGHLCSQPGTNNPQLKAAEMVDPHEIISDAVLDALVGSVAEECATISVNALLGATHPKTIQLRALVENKVVLILVDSGSTHTFVDQSLLSKISAPTVKLKQPMNVSVANGTLIPCIEMVPALNWWIQGHASIALRGP